MRRRAAHVTLPASPLAAAATNPKIVCLGWTMPAECGWSREAAAIAARRAAPDTRC